MNLQLGASELFELFERLFWINAPNLLTELWAYNL